jgi:hypothetical protein
MGAFNYPTVNEIREVLGEEGWAPPGETQRETVVCVDIDDVAEKIDQRLRSQGYLR